MDAWLEPDGDDDDECVCSDLLPMHDCPYEMALDEDYAEQCNCCPACTKRCGMEK